MTENNIVEEERENFKQFKCKIDFKQNVAGICSFSGYIHFDDSSEDAIIENATQLAKLLLITEERFRGMGRKVASDVKAKNE